MSSLPALLSQGLPQAERVLRAGARRRVDAAAGPLARALLSVWDEARIAWASTGSRRRFNRLRGRSDLRVHLGCGADVRQGWINVDLDLSLFRDRLPARSEAATGYVNHDLRRGLPLPAGSCSLIYSSHFFEHLDYRHGMRLMRDCHRALAPGGIFRIVIPDFRACCAAYLDGDADYFDLIPLGEVLDVAKGQQSLVDYMNYVAYQSGEHKWIYDADKLALLLRDLGFSEVRESSFLPEVDLDSAPRRRYSLYMEAVK